MNEQVYLLELVRLSIGLTMFIAVYNKSLSFSTFRKELVVSFGFTNESAKWLAPAVVGIELLLAGCILGVSSIIHTAMIFSLCLFIIFTVVLLWHFFSGNLVRCSCFGEEDRPVSLFDLIRNGVIIFLLFSYVNSMPEPITLSFPELFLLFSLAALISLFISNFHDVMVLLFGSFKGLL